MDCKCGKMMRNYDDINFECPACGEVKYKKEAHAIRHGARYCPVCGHVMIVHENGTYSCLTCNARVARRFNPHERYEIINEKSRGTMEIRTVAVVCCWMTLALVLSMGPIFLW
jgi:predicted RNA-binding Zn-ribbon protein involved in translation (DUF1610 family)